MVDWNFKDLTRTRTSCKTLRDKSFNIAKNPIYDGYQKGLSWLVSKIIDKKIMMEQLKVFYF